MIRSQAHLRFYALAGFTAEAPRAAEGRRVDLMITRARSGGTYSSEHEGHDELTERVIAAAEVHLPINYRGRQLKEHFRVDLLVESALVIEVKSVDQLAPVHIAQILTYLRIGHFERGLLLNFNVERLTKGIRRVSLGRLGGPQDVLGASAVK